MVVYYKCLCSSRDRLRVQQLRSDGHEVRVVSKNPEWRREAKLYDTRLPFFAKDEEKKVGIKI